MSEGLNVDPDEKRIAKHIAAQAVAAEENFAEIVRKRHLMYEALSSLGEDVAAQLSKYPIEKDKEI